MFQRHRLTLLIACTCYYCMLQWSYANVESVLYGSTGFHYHSPPVPFQILAFFMAIAPAAWLPIALDRPSSVCLWMLYLTVIVPTMFIPYHVLAVPPHEVVALPAALLLCFILLIAGSGLPLWELPNIKLRRRTLEMVLAGLALALVGLLVVSSGGLKLNLSLEDVYSRRFAARDFLTAGSLLGYGVAILSRSLVPLSLSIGFLRRNFLLLGCGVTAAAVMFSLAGAKKDFFMPLFLMLLAIVVTRFPKRFGHAVVLGSFGLVFISAMQYIWLDHFQISAYFVRRQIFIPSLLTSLYWDFFTENPYVYYSDGILRWLVPRQYELPIARLIGELHFHSFETNANANVWASGYANIGYVGMLFCTSILAVLLRLIDSIARNGDGVVCALMCGVFALNWSNGALETSMLSNGVLFSLIMLYLLPNPNSDLPAAGPIGFSAPTSPRHPVRGTA